MATDGFQYDPHGAGTEYEMSVPAWALKPCPECHAQHNVEGHAEGCLENTDPEIDHRFQPSPSAPRFCCVPLEDGPCGWADHLHPGHIPDEVSCSSCGTAFLIPGRSYGFSHCDDHAGYLRHR
jgi:hypothetical protein